MKQVRKALARAKVVLKKIEENKELRDRALDECEISTGRELYEIERAFKELNGDELENDNIKIELIFDGRYDKESLKHGIKHSIRDLENLIDDQINHMGVPTKFIDVVFKERSFFIKRKLFKIGGKNKKAED